MSAKAKAVKTVAQCWAEYGDKYRTANDRAGFIARASKDAKATEKHVMSWIAEKGWRRFSADMVQPSVKAIVSNAAKMGMSLEDFRAKFDEAQKIRNAIARLGRGAKCRIYSNQEFRELCGVPVAKWGQYSALKEFDACRIQKGRDEVYWSNEETAEYARNLI